MDKQISVAELVRGYFPDASDKECEYIVWEKTAFPLVSVETLCKQLQDYKDQRGG